MYFLLRSSWDILKTADFRKLYFFSQFYWKPKASESRYRSDKRSSESAGLTIFRKTASTSFQKQFHIVTADFQKVFSRRATGFLNLLNQWDWYREHQRMGKVFIKVKRKNLITFRDNKAKFFKYYAAASNVQI